MYKIKVKYNKLKQFFFLNLFLQTKESKIEDGEIAFTSASKS